MNRIRLVRCLMIFAALVFPAADAVSALTRFVEVSAIRGVLFEHATDEPWTLPESVLNGGVALGDYDNDGRLDLFVVRGDAGGPMLLRNPGNAPFQDMSVQAGLDIGPGLWTAPAFGDINGDGWLDLVVGGVEDSQPRIFQNDRDGTFTEVTGQTGIVSISSPNTFSTSFGDYDRDGDLDLLMGHWTKEACVPNPCGEVLWQNNGDGTFSNVQAAVGVLDPSRRTFSPNFADINNDGWPDLLFTSDFGQSQTYINDGDGTFTETTDGSVITDEYGMGTAIGDYDNDGFLDWFNSSIFGLGPQGTGNRLYRNLGDGTFEDTTDAGGGVRDGSFGWSACFADFDNDMHLDLFHTNGMAHVPEAANDVSRLFMSDGVGGFSEQAATYLLNDTGAGKGVVCWDFDRDGDIDILTVNNNGFSALYRNDGGNDNNYLKVELGTRGKNRFAVGARVYVTVGAVTQMREIRSGTNFQSQDPLEVHFGLGTAATVDELRIVWNDGVEDTYANVAANQALDLSQAFTSYFGVFNPAIGKFLLTDSNVGGGVLRTQTATGGAGLAPVSGDWSGDAIDTVGLFDETAMEFLLWNSYANGAADVTVPLGAGGAGAMPISGDWDGDGFDTVGLYDPVTAEFYLWNSLAGGAPDITFSYPVPAGSIPIAGDWNGDGADGYGFYDPATTLFSLRNTPDFGPWERVFRFGPRFQDLRPVVGDWNRDGFDTIGVHKRLTGTFLLRNSNSTGLPDITTNFGWRGPNIAPVTRSWVLN